MKISLDVPEVNLITNHGYGAATEQIYKTLVSLGHKVGLHDPSAPVELSFTQPTNWQWSNPDAYHIGYVPWESTRLPDGWFEIMEKADEIWATSPWVKWVFEKAGLKNVRVYEHGVDTLSDFGWTRKHRYRPDGPIRFLHMGEPAPRKGGQLTYDTFRETFGDRDDVKLTIKAWNTNTVRGSHHDNVRLITAELDPFQLVDLVKRHDVLVYPSWGEGFGLIPLQAMVTGMPVITTASWAPYARFLEPDLTIKSKMVPSPWPTMHPGNMYQPDAESLSDCFIVAARDFKDYSSRAYDRSFKIESEYDWVKLTISAFRHIEEKFDSE